MKAGPEFVGVDDGHYAIKIVTGDGAMTSIPSRARSGKTLISWQAEDNNSSFYTTEEGTTYTVNEHLQNSEDTRFKEYPKSALNRVLVHHALRSAGLGGKSVVITTGLPVSYYYLPNGRKDDALIQAKSANLTKSVTCGSNPVAKIIKNSVSTEAIAAYIDQLMDLNGTPSAEFSSLQEAMVGVIDVGGKTTDCAVVLPGGQQVDADRSGSNDTGVLLLNDAVESRLKTNFDLDNVPPRMVEMAIQNGSVKVSGESFDVQKIITEEKERLAESIMSGVRTKLGSGKDLDFVLFVGGGAIVMRDQLARHYRHCRFPERPEFANARGMFKIAKHIFGHE